MNWIILAVLVTAFVSEGFAGLSDGYAKTSIECAKSARQGAKVELVCTVKGQLWSGVFWYRPNRKLVARCNYLHTRCRMESNNYDAHVTSSAQVTLTIHSFNPKTDAGQWICKDGVFGEEASCNQTYKRIMRSQHSVQPTTTIGCTERAVAGFEVKLTCTIAGSLWSGVFWVRPDGKLVGNCNFENTKCRSSVSGYSVDVRSPSRDTLTIESFDPATDAGAWTCRDGVDGNGSSCVVRPGVLRAIPPIYGSMHAPDEVPFPPFNGTLEEIHDAAPIPPFNGNVKNNPEESRFQPINGSFEDILQGAPSMDNTFALAAKENGGTSTHFGSTSVVFIRTMATLATTLHVVTSLILN